MESTRMPRDTAIIMLEVRVAGRRVSYSAVLIYIEGVAERARSIWPNLHCLCCWTDTCISVMDNGSWFIESLESLLKKSSQQPKSACQDPPRIKPGEYPNLVPRDLSLHNEHHKSPNMDNTQLFCFPFLKPIGIS